MNKGIMLNIDSTHFWHSRWQWGIYPDEAELRRFIAQYAGTQVTDILIDAGGRLATYPAKSRTSFLDKYHQTVEDGEPVNYKGTYVDLHYEAWEKQGLDPVALWIEEGRKAGIRMWTSFRMNDCHCCMDHRRHLLHPDFYHEHPEYRVVRHRTKDGYYDCNLDYSFPEVRQWFLDFIDETLERYAPDGIELDWQREIYCFAPGTESVEIMNAFMRQVKALVASYEAKLGRKISICARTLADPADSLEQGFDVAQWVDEGLVDVIVPTARWSSTDNDMPLGLWKRLIRGSGVKMAPGIELLIRARENAPYLCTQLEHVNAAAAQYFTFGADKIYLYNYFDDVPEVERTYWRNPGAVRYAETQVMLRTIGDPVAVKAAPRCHMLTYRDQRPQWRKTEYALPAACSAPERFVKLRVVTGEVPAGAKVLVRLGISTDAADPVEVYVNSRPASYVGTATLPLEYTADTVHVYELPSGITETSAVIEVATRGEPLTVSYADITLP